MTKDDLIKEMFEQLVKQGMDNHRLINDWIDDSHKGYFYCQSSGDIEGREYAYMLNEILIKMKLVDENELISKLGFKIEI